MRKIFFKDYPTSLDVDGIMKIIGSKYLPENYTDAGTHSTGVFVKIRRVLGPDYLHYLLDNVGNYTLTLTEVIQSLNVYIDRHIDALVISCLSPDDEDETLGKQDELDRAEYFWNKD